ncbi:MAG: hypothetical protein ABIJ34_08985 [archaeon]
MPLTILNGPDSSINYSLFLLAFEKAPSLVIDCANYADPHKFFGSVPEEKLEHVFIMNAEAIYRFRDSLKKAAYWAERLRIKNVFVTTIGTLFSYDDKEEDKDVTKNCWDIIKELSKRYNVYVATDNDKRYTIIPERYADKIIEEAP